MDLDKLRDELDWVENQSQSPREHRRTDLKIVSGTALAAAGLASLFAWLR
jgi:hypothetical protein